MTQDGWAIQLGYGRATVKRWEAGETVPSADAEAKSLDLCRERALFRRFSEGPLAGVRVTPEWLTDLLAAARLENAQGTLPPAPSPTSAPAIRYALSGDVTIAYQVFGSGPIDLAVTPGLVSHRELEWEHPGFRRFFGNLARFARVIIFDKRGTGMSDRVPAGTLEERMDDIRAVMDAAGARRAALFGVSEGGPMSILFAATYPERTHALMLYGSYASVHDPEHAPSPEPPEPRKQQLEYLRGVWGVTSSRFLQTYGPSIAQDPAGLEWWSRYQRISASPGAVDALINMNADIDVRHVLSAIHIPTLVLHRRGDRAVNIELGRYLAAHIADAQLVELSGEDHLPLLGDVESITGQVEAFLSGPRVVHESDDLLATVLSTDVIVPAREGDGDYDRILDSYRARVREELQRYRGREIDTDGRGLQASFDGPSRAVRCACGIRDAARSLGLKSRSAVHTGEVEVRGGAVSGPVVDASKQVAAIADPGEVFVTSTVTDLVAGSGIVFEERGTCRLEGMAGQLPLFAVDHGEFDPLDHQR